MWTKWHRGWRSLVTVPTTRLNACQLVLQSREPSGRLRALGETTDSHSLGKVSHKAHGPGEVRLAPMSQEMQATHKPGSHVLSQSKEPCFGSLAFLFCLGLQGEEERGNHHPDNERNQTSSPRVTSGSAEKTEEPPARVFKSL